MAKYKMKARSLHLGNRIYRSSEKIVFDTDDKKFKEHADALAANARAGFLEEIKEQPKKAAETKPQSQKAEPKKEESKK